MHGRGEDLLRVNDELDAEPLQAGVVRHEMLARRRGDGERRLAVAGRHRFAHLRLRLRRVEKQDVGACRDKGFQPRQRLIEAARAARIGARQQQYAFLMAGLNGGAAAQDRGVALDHQLGALMPERARPRLVLDQHSGGAAPGIGTDRLLHGERIAVTGVAVGQPQQFRRGGDAGLDRVGHFRERQQIHVGHRQPHRRDAGAGHKGGAEPGLLDQPRTHAVTAAGHHLQFGLVEQFLQRGSLRLHGHSSCWRSSSRGPSR
jgi:hypothetical protein